MSLYEVTAIRSTILARSNALQNVASVGLAAISNEAKPGPASLLR